MSDTPPDRLSVNPRSPHFGGDLLSRGIGVRFKDRTRHDVEEYCVSEGWIRVAMGKSRDRFGQPMTIKLSGPLDVWFEDVGETGAAANDAGPIAAESDGAATAIDGAAATD